MKAAAASSAPAAAAANTTVQGAGGAKRKRGQSEEQYGGADGNAMDDDNTGTGAATNGASKKSRPDVTPTPPHLDSGASLQTTATGTTATTGITADTSPENSKDASNQQSSTAGAKRDREHATVLVRNLPVDTKESRVRRFFADCGTINAVRVIPDEDADGAEGAPLTATATVEFEKRADVLAAQTRDLKELDGNVVEVVIAAGTTLYVANFPASADARYVRELFEKVRSRLQHPLPPFPSSG